jgi:photosystem II stability/assembly factor-like uncharacterized protein
MIRKKKYILFVFLGLINLGNLQAQWITEKSPSSYNLNSVSLINDSSGWIVGDKGTMIYKVNGYWVNYQKITNENLYSVCMLDKNNGWAVGSKGIILHFNGDKWEVVASPTRQKLYSVSFRDPENGIAVGEYGTVAIYENGIWKLAKRVTRGNLYTVSSSNDLSMFGGGLECVDIPLMKIDDDAERTISVNFNPHIEITGIAQADLNDVWVVGSPAEILHFDGSEWNRVVFDNSLPSLNCISFYDENYGITVGYSGTVLTYSPQGWTKQNSPVDVKLNGAFISEKKYYAVGNKGTIISWQPVPDNALSSEANKDSALKIEIYPNPSADILNVIIPAEDGFVTDLISITNSFGQVVLRKKLDPASGGQVYQINTSEMDNGLYLVKIESGDSKAVSGKFIVKH